MEIPSAEGGALRSQDVRTPADPTGLNGTLIRISPDTGEGLPGNPFASSPDANARRIYAFGFRNPFRFTLDPPSGNVYVDNVGWETYEEMDRFPLGSNHAYNSGWPCYEAELHRLRATKNYRSANRSTRNRGRPRSRSSSTLTPAG